MKPLAKLAVFVLVLLGAFGGGAAIGAALPDLGPGPPTAPMEQHGGAQP